VQVIPTQTRSLVEAFVSTTAQESQHLLVEPFAAQSMSTPFDNDQLGTLCV